jgi:hypothetical protein
MWPHFEAIRSAVREAGCTAKRKRASPLRRSYRAGTRNAASRGQAVGDGEPSVNWPETASTVR